MTGIQLATKGIIPKNQKSHGVSIATKGYISVIEVSVDRYETISLESYINSGMSLESVI